MVKKLTNWEKTRALCPSAITSVRRGNEGVELGAPLAGALRIDQPGVARRLAQAQQRLQHVDLHRGQPLALEASEQLWR